MERYDWELVYNAAVLETDNSKLPELIEEARRVVNLRFRELAVNGNDPEERQAAERALRGLKIIWEERCQAGE